MIAIQESQTIGPAILLLLGEKAGMRASYSPAKPLTENPNGVPSFSPGLAAQRPTPGIVPQKTNSIPKGSRGPKPERVKHLLTPGFNVSMRHPQTNPHPKSTVDLGCEGLIWGKNGLRPHFSPTCYRPIIRPENKGIKPNSDRYKPKNFIMGRCAKRLPARVWTSAKPGHDAATHPQGPHSCPLFWYPTPTIANLCQPMPAYASHSPPSHFFREQNHEHLFIAIFPFKGFQSTSKRFKAFQWFFRK
jgi:hypothetical protein